MARLNEAPVPAESHLEILRRKFLRQNRDIAKINSDQSQKIRKLENDCARLLSENLDLRGQILRLEKQIEDNSAQRIADHALEVKAKLEVQLCEFAALLGSLGVEQPSKRRHSGDRMLAKARKSIVRSPPQRRRRDTAVDLDALAEQEGRLPPIYENKTYARATMNSEEILALCAAAEDISESPDLGPPPVSRYIEEEPVKQSPTRDIETVVPESPIRPLRLQSPPNLDYDRKPSKSPEPTKEPGTTVQQPSPSKAPVPTPKPAPEPASQPVRAGAKRKFGDENGIMHNLTTQPGKENAVVSEKAFPTRGGQKRKSFAEPTGIKQEKKATRAPLAPKRTPLAAKSTNEDVSSPRKVMKAAPAKEAKKEQSRSLRESVVHDDSNDSKPLPEIEVLSEPVAQMLETVTALPSAAPSSPATPARSTIVEVLHDTPPPADISSTGETSRPSRRARAAISYAEPNLRDKMRRPTKELFDAVTGEGKYAHRASSSHKLDDHPGPASSTKAKSEMASSTGNSKTRSVCDPPPEAQQEALRSPLAQKDVFPETLPSTVVMERRKRPSVANRESLAALERPESTSREPSPATTAAAQPPAQTNSRTKPTTTAADKKSSSDGEQHDSSARAPKTDIYDFTASSPTASSIDPTPDTSSDFKPTTSSTISTTTTNTTSTRQRPTRKSSLAAAAALRSILDDEDDHDSARRAPPSTATTAASGGTKARSAHGGRKRASMLAPKRSCMLEGLDEESGSAADADTSGTSVEGEVSAREGRISRRRSMML